MGTTIIDHEFRWKQMKQITKELDAIFKKYKITEHEAVWMLEMWKFNMFFDSVDKGVDNGN